MTDKNDYTAKVRAKGLDNTGVTEGIAQKMYNSPGRRTYGIVVLRHARKLDDVDTGRTVELVIDNLEVAQDEQTTGYLEELLKTLHQNRVLASEDAQLKIETQADLAPKPEDVIARQRADQAGKPHVFDPDDEGDNPDACRLCGEDLEHDLHAVVTAPEPAPADNDDSDPEPAEPDTEETADDVADGRTPVFSGS